MIRDYSRIRVRYSFALSARPKVVCPRPTRFDCRLRLRVIAKFEMNEWQELGSWQRDLDDRYWVSADIGGRRGQLTRHRH